MLDDLRNVGTEMRWRKPEGLQRIMNHGETEKREYKKDEKKKRKGVNGVTFR